MGKAVAIWTAERPNFRRIFAADSLQMQQTVIDSTMRGCGSRFPGLPVSSEDDDHGQ
jgi:hypothetical protein